MSKGKRLLKESHEFNFSTTAHHVQTSGVGCDMKELVHVIV